ncbi:MAG: S9 family peptidase [Acidobacteria bacterium]|nr:S9 family peptidase [Acidobacteriota bacterium]
MRRVPGLLLTVLLVILSLAAFAQAKRSMTFDDLISMKRIADAQISPDGSKIAYVVNAINKDANRGKRSIWIVPATGGAAQVFITSDKNDDTLRWSPDGKRVAFLSTREGAPQIFVANADGSNPRKITDVPEGVGEFIWSPDGKSFAFVTDIYPECKDLKCVAEKSAAAENSKVKAVIADRLLYRHWTDFKRGKRSHLFVISAEGGEPKDLTPGDFDVPPFSLGDPTAFAFSPDGKEICFARNTDKDEALSTNNDLFIVPVTGGEAKRITGDNKGSDTTPRYSPDGKYIAYRSQSRNGFESDRFRLMLYDRSSGKAREMSVNFDRWVEDLAWMPDGKSLVLTSQDRGREALFIAPLNGDKFQRIVNEGSSSGVTISADGKTIAFTRSNTAMPAEVFKASANGSGAMQLTKTNAEMLAQLKLPAAEEFEYVGGLKSKIHGFIVKPPQFDKAKKYPMVLLVHGGPQGAWMDNWGYRWNPQMWAARGYVTVLINPHGSTGYGQAFTEQITGEWGGAVYEDLMKGVDHIISLGYVDANRIGAAGGSYGGYMINWMNGHTDRFKALVSHASIFNAESMYATEELWFQEWEWKGAPWDANSTYKKWSPHLFVKNFKTPTLVVHGELDYRVPIGEGLQLFSALQRRGIPSKFLYYPDEGHWVLKPQNSELWYKTVLDWFDQWLKNGGQTAAR